MADPQEPVAPSLVIEKIYVKDLSLENPGAPHSFLGTESPSVEVGLRTRGEQGDKTLFLVEAAQAGLFRVQGISMGDMQPILGIHCPNVLFPYVRETIANAISRAGFPPVHLDPINFELLYQQQLANLQQAPAASPIPS
jgi:preprotein translocase subunit SecB